MFYLKKILKFILSGFNRFASLGTGKQVSISIVLGILVGCITRFIDIGMNPTQFKILGDIFLNLVKMTVVPLVFASIVSAILSIEDVKLLGKTAVKGLMLFFITTLMSVLIGITVCEVIKPGTGTRIDTSRISNGSNVKQIIQKSNSTQIGLKDIVLDAIPSNIFTAAHENDLLKVISFAIIFASSIIMLRGKIDKQVISFMHNLAEIMYELIKIVMKFAPFGIFGLAVWISGSQDINVIKSLAKLVVTGIISSSIIVYILYPSLLFFKLRLNPLLFLKKILPAQIFGLAVASSAATLPLNIKNAKEKMGVSQESADLLMPVGATINMNGSGCYLGFYIIFIAQLYGMHLGISNYIIIIALSILGAVSTPPVPGGAIVVLASILATLNYPIEALSLIFAIDKIIAPLRVAANVTGDCFAALYVDASNKRLNKKIYNNKSL